jgi:hypothetical protein
VTSMPPERRAAAEAAAVSRRSLSAKLVPGRHRSTATATTAASRQVRKVREVRAGAAVSFGPIITFLTSTPVGRGRPATHRRNGTLIPAATSWYQVRERTETRHESHSESEEPRPARSGPRHGQNPWIGPVSAGMHAYSVPVQEPLDLGRSLAAEHHAGAGPMLALHGGRSEVGRLVDPTAAVH